MRRALALMCALLGCGPSALPNHGSKAYLRDVTSIVVVPGFDAFVVACDDLDAAADALATERTPVALATARTAWGDCHSSWKRLEVLDFGPVRDRSLDALVDQWPVDPDKVDALMTGDEPLDDAVVNTGANGRGLPALELLLWDPAIEDVGSPDADRRHALVRALAADVARQAAAIRDVWAPDGEAYATAIAEAGTGSAAYPTAKSAVDVLVNQLLFTTELVLDQKLGRPAGKRTGTPRPEEVEAGRSGRSLAAIGANLDGLEGVYFAMRGDAQGVGLSALIARRSAPADARTRAALAEARALVTAIPEPLDRAVVDDPAAVDAAYQSLRALRQLMATEIVAVLGATLTFNDNDGD